MVKAKAILPTIKLDRLPRMADFAIWGEAVSRAIGRPEGEFLSHTATTWTKGPSSPWSPRQPPWPCSA